MFIVNPIFRTMTSDQNTEKVHYICQTYVETKAANDGRLKLKIGKQFQYSTASQAQDRAEREASLEGCVGADAYMVSEDLTSGEVGQPNFLVRLGKVPDFEAS